MKPLIVAAGEDTRGLSIILCVDLVDGNSHLLTDVLIVPIHRELLTSSTTTFDEKQLIRNLIKEKQQYEN